MSLWKRGRIYWSYVYMDGVRHAKSTGTGNRRLAEVIDQRFKDDLNLKRLGIRQPAPEMTFGELTARFLAEGVSRPYHNDRLKMLLPYFGGTEIGRINKAAVREYREHRHAQKAVSDKRRRTAGASRSANQQPKRGAELGPRRGFNICGGSRDDEANLFLPGLRERRYKDLLRDPQIHRPGSRSDRHAGHRVGPRVHDAAGKRPGRHRRVP